MHTRYFCPKCGCEFERPRSLLTFENPTKNGPNHPYAAYELRDPRDGTTIWVGAGVAKNWLGRALKSDWTIYSERTQAALQTLYEAGFAPKPHLIAYCMTREEAMQIKLVRCQETGLPFRGMEIDATTRTRLVKRRYRAQKRHRQEGASA